MQSKTLYSLLAQAKKTWDKWKQVHALRDSRQLLGYQKEVCWAVLGPSGANYGYHWQSFGVSKLGLQAYILPQMPLVTHFPGKGLLKPEAKFARMGRGVLFGHYQQIVSTTAYHQLPNYNSNNPSCKCNRSDTPWNDFNATALWRAKRYTKEEVHETPMSPHWAFTIPGVNHGTFAHDFCALCRFGFLLGSCCKPGKRSDRIAQLLDLVNQCYDDLEISVGRISRLALSHFTPDAGAPHKHYPTLMHSARHCGAHTNGKVYDHSEPTIVD